MSKVTDIEKESLEAHVELCAERYDRMAEKMENLEQRMDVIEATLTEIKGILTIKETQAYRKLISIAITVIGALSTTIVGLVLYVAKAKLGL